MIVAALILTFVVKFVNCDVVIYILLPERSLFFSITLAFVFGKYNFHLDISYARPTCVHILFS